MFGLYKRSRKARMGHTWTFRVEIRTKVWMIIILLLRYLINNRERRLQSRYDILIINQVGQILFLNDELITIRLELT
jgi:hypothetical protein